MRKGFTLAEVLITLGIIGVVAAITLPTLFSNISGYINTKRQENIGQKVTKAMENMRAHGLLNTQYSSTDAFVNEFQKYIKISKRCDSAHIADCWPTSKITTAEGEEYDVSQATTGKHLSLESESDNVGLILADGASIILNYNPNAQTIDVGSRVQWVSGLPQYTTTVTDAIDFVMDVNGAKSPNSEKDGNKRDIRPFKSAKFTVLNTCEGADVPGVGCVVKLTGTYNWNSAHSACLAKEMNLPVSSQMDIIYNYRNQIDGLPTSGTYWVNKTEYPYWAYYRNFSNNTEPYMHMSEETNALCVK